MNDGSLYNIWSISRLGENITMIMFNSIFNFNPGEGILRRNFSVKRIFMSNLPDIKPRPRRKEDFLYYSIFEDKSKIWNALRQAVNETIMSRLQYSILYYTLDHLPSLTGTLQLLITESIIKKQKPISGH